MIFNSYTYLLFLAVTVVLYWHLPRTPRLAMLFAASCLFYGFWRFDFLLLLLASVVTDYFVGIALGALDGGRQRKLALAASLTVNLGLLAFFKYFYFITGNGAGIARWLGYDVDVPALDILLPVGISFYTFQTLSYTIDVYRRQIPPCRDFLLFANFVMYFPQLVAGPILRASEVVGQLDTRAKCDPKDIAEGLQRIIAGLFLKVVLADNVAGWVDDGFASNSETLSAPDVLTLAFLFGFQIYFDFAAYSHIAIGSAQLMGIRFPENFNYPYLAVSPRDFWGRWHISLSSWVRDYLYLPLAGAAGGHVSTGGLADAARISATSSRAFFALFAAWAIMGLWHGAAWAFVIWGLWHAVLIALYRVSAPLRHALPPGARAAGGWLWTLPMVMLAWIPFRTQSVGETLTLWGHLLDPNRWLQLGLRENYYLIASLLLAGCLLTPLAERKLARLQVAFPRLTQAAAIGGTTVAIALVLIYLRATTQFIYFQF